VKLERPSTEAELCDALVTAAARDGWDAFPEVSGWDLVLVWTGRVKVPALYCRDREPEAGYQLAVEAKLRPGVDAIVSAIDRRGTRRGPDEVALLVPHAGRSFVRLCRHLDLRVLTLADCGRGELRFIAPRSIPGDPAARLRLPPIALQGSGGAPSPRTLSAWRVGALRICRVLRERGWITRDDFRAHGVDRTRWVNARWIRADGTIGRLARYVPGPRFESDGPDVGYEAERDALAELDARETPAP